MEVLCERKKQRPTIINFFALKMYYMLQFEQLPVFQQQLTHLWSTPFIFSMYRRPVIISSNNQCMHHGIFFRSYLNAFNLSMLPQNIDCMSLYHVFSYPFLLSNTVGVKWQHPNKNNT